MLPENKSLNIREILQKIRIIPVAVFNDVDKAMKTAELLLKNSINILEITLRTEAAFECISKVKADFPEMMIGAGSVLSKESFEQAFDSGAVFCVAPSLDIDLIIYSSKKKISFIPGVITPTELNAALSAGSKIIKIFPAAGFYNTGYIKSITAPFKMKDFSLVPTGGINENNIIEYLKTDKVIACGASYISDPKLIDKGDFEELDRRIKKIKSLVSAIQV